MKEDVSIITDNLQSISVDIDDLKSRVTLLEVRSDDESTTHTDCRQTWQQRKTDSKTL